MTDAEIFRAIFFAPYIAGIALILIFAAVRAAIAQAKGE